MSDLLYTLSDGPFYESPENYKPDDSVSSILQDVLPPDWKLRQHGIWLIAEPHVQNLPEYGYKIHVSTRQEYRERIIKTTAEISADFNATIKCLGDFKIWTRLHDKPYAAEFPLNYGKAITIYPENIDSFSHIARELATELKVYSGPDVITDIPILNSRCVYYRYGGFLTPDDDSEEIDDDDRTFPELTSPHTDDEDVLPHPIDNYKLQHAIQNGIYVAEKDGETVVIKEASEDFCIDDAGRDAVTRLLSELDILHALLADANAEAPKPIESFKMWRNLYVVMSHLPGSPLTELHRKLIPLQTRLNIATGVADALSKLHKHRIVWGDASPANVLWEKKTEKIYLVDFEHARQLTENPAETVTAGTPGFKSTQDKTLFPLTVVISHCKMLTSDIHALGFLLLYIFAPVNAMFDLDPTAPHRFLKAMSPHLPKQLITVIENCLNPEVNTTAKNVATTLLRETQAQDTPTTDSSDNVEIPISTYQKTLNDIIAFIKAHLTFDRQDRLFPCSPEGFALPLSIAHGASGLATTNMRTLGEDALVEQTIDWILAHKDFSDEQKLLARPGFWAGTAGLATLAGRFAETDEARKRIFLIAAKHIRKTDEFNRYDGIAGVAADAALTLYNDTNDDFFLSIAKDLADQLIAQAVDADKKTRIWKSPDDDTIYTGYLFGVAGAAAFLFQLADQLKVNQQHYTDIAEQALFWVEKQSIVAEDGCIAIPITAGGDTYARNLAHGNAGIAKSYLCARQYFGTDKDDFIRKLLLPDDAHIRETAFSHTPAASYFYGLAGIGSVLLDAFSITGETAYLTHAHTILKDLLCFQVTHEEGVGFPGGAGMKRLSCDFSTGSLGVADFIYHFLKAVDMS